MCWPFAVSWIIARGASVTIPEYLQPVLPEPKPGPIDPAFQYADKLTGRDVIDDPARFLPLREAERHRLVEAAKSPTATFEQLRAAKNAFSALNRVDDRPATLAAMPEGPFHSFDRESKAEAMRQESRREVTEPRAQSIIEYRAWCDEFRIRSRVLGKGTPPKPVEGTRESDRLSFRAALKISESCAYMAAKRGGYQTFVTGTFSDAARARVSQGETSIQAEITRTMDAIQQMYRRGWTNEKTGHRIAGHDEALPYCWVVEVPENEHGEPNPHVHMLLGWSVPYAEFEGWAARIEAIWGNGYFHLEKIKDPDAAGAYMAKAAGYLCKAQGRDDQGTVKGNRYAISSTARAPGWEVVAIKQLGIMGRLIRDVYDSMQAKYAGLYHQRKQLNEAREKVRQKAKAAQDQNPENRYPLAAKTALEKIGARLMAVRNTINGLPARPGKYQLILKGRKAFRRFMDWAESMGLKKGVDPASPWVGHFLEQRRLRQRLRVAWQSTGELAKHVEQLIDYRDSALTAFEDYEQAALAA